MRLWLIPATYVAMSSAGAMILPRLEHAYLGAPKFTLSVASAQAVLSTTASGMMALTAIVFAVAFVVVQFSATAYSPRVVLWLTRDRTLFHTLGIFVATFVYALWTLAWVDRSGSGTVPMFSVLLVGVLVIVSMLLFAQMVERLNDLQISHILQAIGDSGRGVIKAMFVPLKPRHGLASEEAMPAATPDARVQMLTYSGPPRTIATLDIGRLVAQAQQAGGVIVMSCAVGDTVVEGETLLEVHGSRTPLSERDLRSAIHLAKERTFEQDPKYPIRLLVDIAIKALSPAVNDPTTAVQTIDQIEDLLRRLGRSELDVGRIRDGDGTLRLVVTVPTWEDYLALSFDEIRQFGATSVQVMRRMRSALMSIADYLTDESRGSAVRRYLDHLDNTIERSSFDQKDRTLARQEDRQGIGLSRQKPERNGAPSREAAA
jgi:uncharacterized membrane protein